MFVQYKHKPIFDKYKKSSKYFAYFVKKLRQISLYVPTYVGTTFKIS
jgi:hypothetical protein